MTVSEIKNPSVTIRIHDDYFEASHQARIDNISNIITSAYKRKQFEHGNVKPESRISLERISK